MNSILFGLLSALSWGGGDFFGGLASRKAGAYRAVLYAEVIGLAMLFGALAFTGETQPPLQKMLLAGLAGAIGTGGLLILYQAMIVGQMSIATPVSALLAATLPVVVGTILDGLPSLPKLIGFGLALLAVWLVAQEDSPKSQLMRFTDLRLPLMAGICFGLYFVLMHQASDSAVVWPMVASRTGGSILMLGFMLTLRHDWRISNSKAWPLVMVNAVLDVGGNIFYILASQTGRMDVSAVISSLYPGTTVLLAWIVLKEKINRLQWLGIAAALGAIALMTV